MFCLDERFCVCGEDGEAYGLTEVHFHHYTIPSGVVKNGRFEFNRIDGLFCVNMPDIKEFRCIAEISRSNVKEKTIWEFRYGFCVSENTGYAISLEYLANGTQMTVSHVKIRGKERQILDSTNLINVLIEPETWHTLILDRRENVINVGFDDKMCAFSSPSEAGVLCLSQSGSVGEVFYKRITISSPETPKYKTELLLSASMPCYDGGSEPYTLKIHILRYLNGSYSVSYCLTGGAASRPERDYKMGNWSVQYDVFKNPFIRIFGDRSKKKLILRNGDLVFTEQNPTGRFAELFMDAGKTPYQGTFFLPSDSIGKIEYVSFGYEQFRRLGNEFQADSREYIFSETGDILFEGHPLENSNQISVASPKDKKITALIPNTVTEYKKAFFHAQHNHYFLSNEPVRFDICAVTDAQDYISFQLTLETAFFRPIRSIAAKITNRYDHFLCNFGKRAFDICAEVGVLPQSVYHLRVEMFYGSEKMASHVSAFEILDLNDKRSPRESAGIPFLYSGEGAPPNIRYNCPDPWIEKPDFNACHYFDCLLCQPEISEERRVWELLKLYKIKLFAWIDGRTAPEGKTWRDYPQTVRHADYLDVDSKSGEAWYFFHTILQHTPSTIEILKEFRELHPEYNSKLPKITEENKSDPNQIWSLLAVCPEEWISYLNRRTNEQALAFQAEIRKFNEHVKFGKYGALGFYMTNHVNAYAGKWRTNDMENFSKLRDGFSIFEDYAFITGQQPYYCAWGLMGYMLHTPDLQVLPEFFSNFDPVCPDEAVFFANPPMGKCSVPAYQVATQLCDYMFASCTFINGRYQYYRDNKFQLLQSYNVEPAQRLETFLRTWGSYLENKPKKPLRAPTFVSCYTSDEDIYDFDIGRKAVNNRSLAGVSYLYQIMSECGLPRGFVTNWDGLLSINADDTDLIVLPSLHAAPKAVIPHLRGLAAKGVSLFAVGDVTGLEDIFGVARQDQTVCVYALQNKECTDHETIFPHEDTLFYVKKEAEILLNAESKNGEQYPVLLKYNNCALLNIYVEHVGIEYSPYFVMDTANISRLLKQYCKRIASDLSNPIVSVSDHCGICLFETVHGDIMILLTDYTPYGVGHGKTVTVEINEISVCNVLEVQCTEYLTPINILCKEGQIGGFSVEMREREARLFRLITNNKKEPDYEQRRSKGDSK